jgi:signal transduction histidine kinase
MTARLIIFRSIFLKLILIVIVFGALINLAIWAFLRFSIEGHPRIVPRYIDRMSDYVIKDIGSPPDTLKARNLSIELGIGIRYQSHDFNFATAETIPTLEQLSGEEEFKEHFPFVNNFSMDLDRHKIIIFKSGKGVFILVPPTPQDFFNPERAIFILVILVSVIFIPLYIILRLLLNPLKVLSNMVQQIGKGNYDVEVPIKRRDELGELADSIKTMAGNIKHSMKSKEQLLIDVSHELRSPLTRIKLGLEVNSSSEKINDDVREMENMISGLLESYKSDSTYDQLKIEKVDLKELLDEMKDEYELDGRVDFVYDENKDYMFKADPSKFKIALRNLIDNGLKYSIGKVKVELLNKNGFMDIKVWDKGIGIPEKDLDFIFEPFYRADPSRSRRTGGFGLGLSICKKIVDAHHGMISVSSKVNEGTEFILTFKKYT